MYVVCRSAHRRSSSQVHIHSFIQRRLIIDAWASLDARTALPSFVEVAFERPHTPPASSALQLPVRTNRRLAQQPTHTPTQKKSFNAPKALQPLHPLSPPCTPQPRVQQLLALHPRPPRLRVQSIAIRRGVDGRGRFGVGCKGEKIKHDQSFSLRQRCLTAVARSLLAMVPYSSPMTMTIQFGSTSSATTAPPPILSSKIISHARTSNGPNSTTWLPPHFLNRCRYRRS
ncbi:hypothetical protein B0H34DRAFT_119892 [Crassisporium funariophilum]|nr:hypothetical protein B0H34DRAFT_119892 [Crassisporium funariophilum]